MTEFSNRDMGLPEIVGYQEGLTCTERGSDGYLSTEKLTKSGYISPEQEKFVKSCHSEYKNKSYESIKPLGNRVIIECLMGQSLIKTPDSAGLGQIESKIIYSVSEDVEKRYPDIKHKLCEVNMSLLNRMGTIPCGRQKKEGREYLYFVVNIDQVEYIYE